MTTSLNDIITMVRQRGNMEANNFVTDAELTSYINNSLAELDGLIAMRYEDYRLASYIVVINGGINNIIPVPSDFWKLRGVDYQLQQGAPNSSAPIWYSLKRFEFPQRNRFNNNMVYASSQYGKNIGFYLSAQGITLTPASYATGTYQVWYTPKFRTLNNITDILDIYMDTQAWVEYAVVDCCIKILNKQNLDPSGFIAEKERLKIRIESESDNRTDAGPSCVIDSQNTSCNDYYGDWGYGY